MSADVTSAAGHGWDVVVVGGGIGGLAVASLLASAGRAVLLLDAADQLGGEWRDVTQDGHQYDAGVSLFTGAGPGGAVAALCDRLGVSLPSVPCDPAIQVALPRHRMDLSSGTDGWWPEIQREFPEDEEGWHALVADLAALARDREELTRHLSPYPPAGCWERFRCWRILTRRGWAGGTRQATRRLRKAAGTSFRETLAEYGLGAASRHVLEACLWYLLVRGTDECSTLGAAVALQRLRETVTFLAGGPGTLADFLLQRLREHGGAIRLRTEVARCAIERGRIVGVTTTAGETIRAHRIVADMPPGVLTGHLAPTVRGWLRRCRAVPGPWHPHRVAQVLGVTVPETFLPSALGRHCLVVRDAGRPARDENLVFVRRTSAEREPGLGDGLARLTVGRFVSPATAEDQRTARVALLGALDQVIPGVADEAVHQLFVPSTALGELWGRPMAAVRYEVESGEWLGRRGLSYHTGWPNLHAVGEWTYPGRLVADVVEGAMRVADTIIGATTR